MNKQPLYSIDTLFQQKLEELPVDASLQHQQWQLLSKSMYRQPNSFQSQLNNPIAKLFYMTIVALVPFGLFYLSNQQKPTTSKALNYTGASVTQSLLVLNKPVRSVSFGKPGIHKQASVEKPVKELAPATLTASHEEVKTPGVQPEKSKDSIRTAPLKGEKPVIKKADSTYIYWQ